MIDRFTFLNDTWSWPVLLGAAVLFVVFIWKESSQFSSIRFYIKVVVAFLAILSLAMIALRPALLNTENSGNLIILTENYTQTSLDSLKKEQENIKVLNYTLDTPIIKELVGTDSVFILGHGIKSYDLWQLEGKSVKYLEGAPLSGIIKFNYDLEQAVGDKTLFKGLYSNPTQGNRLVLEGAGRQVLDSVILLKKTEQQFSLNTDLKSAGNFIFRITEKDSLGNLISSNPIPLKVAEKEALNILMINGFPTFETKYLKNFLAEMDHKVIVRSQVTKGKYKYEYFNAERSTIGNISEKLLESYDLLIIDFNSFKTLSTSQKNAIEKSVRDYGLGVFIQPDVSLFGSSSGLASFDYTQDNSKETMLNGNLQVTKYPFTFKQSLTLEPILKPGNQILSAYKRIGQGKVGSSVLENTFELLLDGNTSAYQQLWTKIINALSKSAVASTEWSSQSKMGFPNEPFQFRVRTIEKAPIVLNSEKTEMALRQEFDIPKLWTGTTYPKQSGWHKLSLQQDSTGVYNYYVYNIEDWETLNSYERIQQNLRVSNSAGATNTKNTNSIPITLLYFYLVFLISIGILWLEPKLRSY
ncbi:hypothetical protein [Gillisia sp. JM1]|uniref:hypothetical protein n=1 Tax=Gillisia sp. JM1 TaxID=1283286 RepID=UPI00040D8D6F|nr:hypothetical protein [Gillisia sp. JM1]